MEPFETAFDHTIRNEDAALRGVVTDDPADPGGVTRWGISQRFLDQIGSSHKARDLSLEAAKKLYETHFWNWYHLEVLPAVIAIKLFDFIVNAGPDPGFRCLQRAVRACGIECAEDGVLGAKTKHAVSLCPEHCLLAALRSECAGFYRDLDKPRFERGWVDRAYR